MSKLGNLKPAVGSTSTRKRIGRGTSGSYRTDGRNRRTAKSDPSSYPIL